MELNGKVVLVTGGGSGLGAASARRFARAGARIVLADVNATGGEAVAKELGAAAVFVKTDVCDEAEARATVDTAKQRFGALHGAINCAGIAPAERVLGRTGPHGLAMFQRVINVNLIGTFNVIRLAAEAMAQNEPGADGERGVIVNTASVAAYEGQIGQAAYSASKAGVAGMTLPIARELARFGIRVLTIAPGIMETPMVAAMTAEVQASLGAQVPFPSRLGKPDEYAALAEHIFSNVMLNGEVIRLDGAIRMGPK
ncbi:MAG TPA: SDR family NAD(P)-dependent oxidoreductase [Burkholderiales bacterium]|nr:SDR family NAD(P)-dependent oxidoreductase [Burkholderiales bacterium]